MQRDIPNRDCGEKLQGNSVLRVSFVAAFSLVFIFLTNGAGVDAAVLGVPLTIPNPAPATSSAFGSAIAASSGNILVGSNGDGPTEPGAAYLFNATTGALLQTFSNPSATPAADRFGLGVAFHGSNALIGARGDDTGGVDNGIAYLMDSGTGNVIHTFLNPQAATSSSAFFGASIAGSGNRVLIGSSGDDTLATNAGAAFLFDSGTGNLLQTIQNPTPASGDNFGSVVDFFGSEILVGSRFGDAGGSNVGSVHKFDQSGTLLQTFLNPTPSSGDAFGVALAVQGNNVLIGASGDSGNIGAAYLFDGTTGLLKQTYLNPSGTSNEGFGFFNTLAFAGDQVVIGAPVANIGATNTGIAYVFDRDSGVLKSTLLNTSPASHDRFGVAVAGRSNGFVIGSDQVDGIFGGVFGPGEVFVFTDPAPEPSGIALGLVGLLSLGMTRRRRRR